MDVKAITDMLEAYVRPATFPVGLKMLKPGEVFPPRTRTPADLGSHFATCQTINIVRRYGWSIGLAAEHHSCPLGLVALGLKPNVEYVQEGHACLGMYTESLESRSAHGGSGAEVRARALCQSVCLALAESPV